MSATQKILRFGVFELNLDEEELRRSGTIIKLAPQPFRLLALLANHAGQIVTREEIKEQVWGEETYVDFEQGMNHCIKQIRTVLGDNADNPLYVETLPRRGYRFLAPVVSKNVLAPAPQIIKSTSGVQSGVLPALASAGEPTVVSASEAMSASDAARVDSTEALGREENSAPRQSVTSATAAAEALAPEIARLREPPNRIRLGLGWIAVVIAVLVAGVLYWYSHQP